MAFSISHFHWHLTAPPPPVSRRPATALARYSYVPVRRRVWRGVCLAYFAVRGLNKVLNRLSSRVVIADAVTVMALADSQPGDQRHYD